MAQLPTRENLQYPAYIKKKKITRHASKQENTISHQKKINQQKYSPRNERGKGITRKATEIVLSLFNIEKNISDL